MVHVSGSCSSVVGWARFTAYYKTVDWQWVASQGISTGSPGQWSLVMTVLPGRGVMGASKQFYRVSGGNGH